MLYDANDTLGFFIRLCGGFCLLYDARLTFFYGNFHAPAERVGLNHLGLYIAWQRIFQGFHSFPLWWLCGKILLRCGASCTVSFPCKHLHHRLMFQREAFGSFQCYRHLGNVLVFSHMVKSACRTPRCHRHLDHVGKHNPLYRQQSQHSSNCVGHSMADAMLRNLPTNTNFQNFTKIQAYLASLLFQMDWSSVGSHQNHRNRCHRQVFFSFASFKFKRKANSFLKLTNKASLFRRF